MRKAVPNTMVSMKMHHLILIIVVAGLPLVTAADEFSIGTQGAAIELDDTWERRQINADFGPDQFVSIKGFWCFVTEFRGLLDGPSDLDRLLATIVGGLPTTMEVIDEGPRTHHDQVDGVDWVTRRMTVRLNGLKLAYQFDVVGGDGLAYLFMTWAMASQETDLYDWASRVARSLSMPPPESEWGQSRLETSRPFRLENQVVEMTFRGTLLVDYWVKDDDDMTTLATLDDELAVHLAIFENTDSTDEYLDQVVEYFDDGLSSTTEKERSDVEIEAGRGRQVRVDYTDSEGTPYVFALAAIPIDDELILDVRMVVMASAWCEEREDLWSELMSTIRVTEDPKIDAFPEPAESDAVSRALNESAQVLLDHSESLAESHAWNTIFMVAPDGLIYAHQSEEITIPVVGDETEERVVAEFTDWVPNRVLDWWDGELVALDPDGNVVAVQEGIRRLGFSADRFAVIDDDRLLVVPRREVPEVFGYESLPVLAPAELVIRDHNGNESSIASFDGRSVLHLAVSRNTLQTLVATRKADPLAPGVGESTTSLWLMDINSGKTQRLPEWRIVSSITASADGWLVSGSPIDGPNALYLMADDGQRELLMTGDVKGLALEDGLIVYATNLHLDDESGFGPVTTVYESPLDLVREHGPRCRPFTVESINLIAARAVEGDVDLSTTDGYSSFLEAAEASSRDLTGIPLPSETAAIDRLLVDLSYDTDISSRAIELLSAMVGNALVQKGARWIDGPRPPGAPQFWNSGWIGESLFTIAVQPHQVVLNTLYSEDGWWRPVSSILDSAAGRKILVGVDEGTLEAEIRAEDPSEAIAWIEASKTKKIGQIVDEHPDNTHLRSEIYQQLAARSSFAVMEDLADSMIRKGEPVLDDWRAWAVARQQLSTPTADVEFEIERLRAAIGEHPETPSLYLLLGAAYERSSRDDRLEAARACYLRVSELRTWGTISDEAETALLRLDGDPAS